MTELNLFEQGTFLHLRFEYKGQITIEDLWCLSLLQLNEIAVNLHNTIQKEEVSFISVKSPTSVTNELKLQIVKRVIEVKQYHKKQQEDALINKLKKQELLELKAAKQLEQKLQMSLEEIDKQLEELEKH